MIEVDKVYLMTQAAIFEEKEKDGALKTVQYRRKDYILLHMMLIFLSVTVAYALLVGGILFMLIMAQEEVILNVGQMLLIAGVIIAVYIVILICYFMISNKYYGEKHVRARKKIQRYLVIMNELSKKTRKEEKKS